MEQAMEQAREKALEKARDQAGDQARDQARDQADADRRRQPGYWSDDPNRAHYTPAEADHLRKLHEALHIPPDPELSLFHAAETGNINILEGLIKLYEKKNNLKANLEAVDGVSAAPPALPPAPSPSALAAHHCCCPEPHRRRQLRVAPPPRLRSSAGRPS